MGSRTLFAAMIVMIRSPLSLPAARLGAEVVATDIAPGMIERLETHARKEGLANLEARVMDGQTLELEDDTFDITGSQNGVSLFPDLQRGLRELVRVTKPGGCVVIGAFGPPSEVEFIGFFMGALQATVPGFDGLPMDPPPLSFQVADPEKLHERMAEAGLKDLRVETVTRTMEFQSPTHLWDAVTSSNPLGAELVADLTHEQRAEVQQVLDGKLHERSGGSGPAVLTARMNIGIETKRANREVKTMAAPTSTEENKRLARRIPEEVATEGNIDLLDEICAEDVINHNPLGNSHSRAAAKNQAEKLRVAFGDFSATVEDIIAEGDTVAMRVTLRGTHDGEFQGIEPTGTEFEIQNMVFTRIEDGRIAERWIHPDMLGLMQQLGIVERPGK